MSLRGLPFTVPFCRNERHIERETSQGEVEHRVAHLWLDKQHLEKIHRSLTKAKDWEMRDWVRGLTLRERFLRTSKRPKYLFARANRHCCEAGDAGNVKMSPLFFRYRTSANHNVTRPLNLTCALPRCGRICFLNHGVSGVGWQARLYWCIKFKIFIKLRSGSLNHSLQRPHYLSATTSLFDSLKL